MVSLWVVLGVICVCTGVFGLLRRTLVHSPAWLHLGGRLDAVLPRRTGTGPSTTHTTHTDPNSRGVALHFGTWGRDVVGKPPVVFAADGPVTIAAFEATFVKVAESHPDFDRRVFMFEPVGQGRSRGAVGGAIECSLGQLAADVIELLRGWGHAQYVLCFSCSNALVAVEVARRAPDLVAAVVGIQCVAPVAQLAWMNRLDRQFVIRTPVVGQLLNYLTARSLAQMWWQVAVPAGAVRDTVAAIVDGDIAEGGHFCLASLMQQYGRDEPALLRLRCAVPLLVVFGAKDRSHRRTPPTSLLSIADGPSDSVVFESCGHLPEMEDPDGFCRHVAAFLRHHGVDAPP